MEANYKLNIEDISIDSITVINDSIENKSTLTHVNVDDYNFNVNVDFQLGFNEESQKIRIILLCRLDIATLDKIPVNINGLIDGVYVFVVSKIKNFNIETIPSEIDKEIIFTIVNTVY